MLGGVLILTAWSAGCGYSQGELLYMLGAGRGQVVEAKYNLTDKPILVLLDDPTGRMDLPAAKHHFVDELSQLLIKNKAAKKIIPRQTVQSLRQAEPDFERRGCREVGELAVRIVVHSLWQGRALAHTAHVRNDVLVAV